ncbi:hypothetical protein CMV_003664 [Castanea mollissima]|uniref:Uncharacterized protein n=1 Tax=Castanea mollissima TaxID=60419 RepID=A0A8J4RH17_9ROSI|nr:hypothetical protein CMV_003664 [Castanea mollissima]
MAVTGDENEEKASVHLLECIHKELSSDQNVSLESCHFFNFCKIWSTQTEEQEYADFIQSFRSVRELKTKGIHFKPINSSFLSLAKLGKSISLRNVEFRSRFISAELKLPPLFLDPAKIKVYNNLAAFEWCPPTVNALVITSYICFLNTLIDGPDDVRELRSKRILLNNVGSDQEVLKMLREMTTFERQDVALYQGVRKAIEKHYNNKIRTWVAEIINKYFSTPLAALGLFGAITFLVLAIVQTRFTIYPIKEK